MMAEKCASSAGPGLLSHSSSDLDEVPVDWYTPPHFLSIHAAIISINTLTLALHRSMNDSLIRCLTAVYGSHPVSRTRINPVSLLHIQLLKLLHAVYPTSEDLLNWANQIRIAAKSLNAPPVIPNGYSLDVFIGMQVAAGLPNNPFVFPAFNTLRVKTVQPITSPIAQQTLPSPPDNIQKQTVQPKLVTKSSHYSDRYRVNYDLPPTGVFTQTADGYICAEPGCTDTRVFKLPSRLSTKHTQLAHNKRIVKGQGGSSSIGAPNVNGTYQPSAVRVASKIKTNRTSNPNPKRALELRTDSVPEISRDTTQVDFSSCSMVRSGFYRQDPRYVSKQANSDDLYSDNESTFTDIETLALSLNPGTLN
jgi:hypothetical protein